MVSGGSAADVLILDFAINDKVFRVGDAMDPYEAFLRYAAAEHPGVLVILLQSACTTHHGGNALFGQPISNFHSTYSKIADAYGVPFVSLPDVVGSDEACEALYYKWRGGEPPGGKHSGGGSGGISSSMTWNSDSDAHPPWPVHQIVADLLASAWWSVTHNLDNLKGAPGTDMKDANLMPGLPEPLSRHSSSMLCLPGQSMFYAHSLKSKDRVENALQSYRIRTVPADGGWQMVEDRPYKPGWVSTKVGSTIEFDLTFGALPKIALTYLMGPRHAPHGGGAQHDQLCPITIGLKLSAESKVDPAKTFVLDPTRDDISLSQYETLIVPPRVIESMGFIK